MCLYPSGSSPVFDAMLTHDFEEAKTGRIILEDVAAEVFDGILKFLYTDEIECAFLERFAEDLYRVVDKYNLEKLFRLCEDWLLKKVTVENALVMYDFASNWPESLLAKRTTEMILK